MNAKFIMKFYLSIIMNISNFITYLLFSFKVDKSI